MDKQLSFDQKIEIMKLASANSFSKAGEYRSLVTLIMENTCCNECKAKMKKAFLQAIELPGENG